MTGGAGRLHAEFIGGGGLRTHFRVVPFCPSAQPQGGLSLPPELGPFFLDSRWRARAVARIGRHMTACKFRDSPATLSGPAIGLLGVWKWVGLIVADYALENVV